MKRLLLALLLVIGPLSSGSSARVDLVLSIDGNKFKVDGTAKFLVFVSYFDGLDVSGGNLAYDFGELKERGVDGVRVFPNWWGMNPNYHYAQDTLIDPDGNLRSGTLANLLDLLDIAKAEGLLVDLSFSAETVKYCGSEPCVEEGFPDNSDLTIAELTEGLVDLADELDAGGSAYKHVLIDIQNESDRVGPTVLLDDPNDVDAIAEAIHAEASNIPVTISLSGQVNWETAAQFAVDAEVDVATWHEEQLEAWWNYTADRVDDMQEITSKPIYLQEPLASDEGDWTRAGIEDNVQAAKASGAAAWCFHTRVSFQMNSANLWDELNGDEEDFFDELLTILAGVSWGS
jgi:hypothetical protein